MAGQATIGVSLQFNADVNAAKQNIQSLQQALASLSKINIGNGLNLDKDFLSAKQSAIELKNILNQTFNQQTGKLDLRAFNSSIQASGKSLTEYRQQLGLLGADGDKAFRQVANAVMSAEVPLLKTNKLAASLWDSLKRTAKWQLSSSIIHGFMGAVQKAYGYAQDLNESLNNIRIVTGYNADKMADFAKEANKAAQALSTTTTAYTDASLIYFQQGLSDAQVKERADVTINMANVTRQSAETVSDQMTAVWNNFAKGGENLESYADKMVALGAATASSSDEIAQGLEKFAAVADTVGLSFDYAAAALATVTAETRQSADTVGTAFKTLFARLESLSLGDTLEDGTDLTKYSKALQAVGIDIKNASGELKDMDIILDELGAKWQTLAKDQQVALAQTVAGQRQYTQLVALMSNWDKFQENLTTTRNSEGALQEQADIYAESWEAARKRVQAALEEIYDKLISSDGFISLLNGAEKFINLISKIIDGLGGLQGVLGLIGVIVTKVFSNELIAGVDNLILRFKDFSGQTAAEMAALKTEASVLLDEMKDNEASGILLERNLNLQKTAINLGDKLTQTDLLRIQNQIAFNNELYNAATAMENEIKKGKELISVLQEQLQVADLVRDSVVPAQTSAANIRQAANYSLQTANSTDFTYDTPEGVAAINNFSNNFNAMDASAISDKAAAAAEAWGQAEAKLNEFMEKQQQGVEIAESSVKAVQAKIIEAIKTILEEANKLKIKDADGNILSPTNTEELTKRTSQLEENFKQLAIHKKELGKIKTDSTDMKDITKEAEKLQKIMQQMSKEKGMPTFSDKEIKSSVNSAEDLEKKLKMVNDRLKERESYMNKGDGLGVSPEEIARMRQMGEQTANVAEATENLGNVIEMPKEAYDQLLNSLDQTAISFGKVVNMASQYGMSIGMASSAMSGLVSSIADGNFGFQNLTSLMMTASMAIRTWNQGIELGKKIQETANTIKEISIALDKKELSVEQAKDIQTKISKSNILQLIFAKKAKKLATIGETAATEADTVATDVNAAAVRAHPILGPLLAILGLVVIAISAVTTAIDKNTQKIHENAEESAQKAEETRKEVKALNEQKQAYDDVYDRFKQGIATKDEYTEATSSLAKALGIENAAILIEQGRYEELNRLIDEYLKKKKIEAADAARESVKNRQKDVKTQAEEIGLKTYSQGNGTLFNSAMLPGNGDISWNNFDTTNFKSIQKTGNTIGVKAIDLKDEDAVQFTINELKSAMEYAKNQGASEEYIQKFKDEIKHLEEWKRKYFDANLDDFRTIVEGLEASGDIKTDFSDLNFDNYDGKIKEVAQTILDENLPEMTEEIANQLAQELVSGKDTDLAKKIDLVDKLFEVSPEQKEQVKEKIHDFIEEIQDESTINFLLSLPDEELQKLAKAKDLADELTKYNNQIIEFRAETNFDTARKAETEFADLNAGDTVEASKIESIKTTLEAAGISADNFFTKMADGTYLVKNRMAELSETLETAKIDNYTTAIESLKQELNENIDNASGLKNQLLELRESMSLDSTSEDIQKLRDLETEYNQLGQKNDELLNKIKELDYELANSATSFDQLDLYLRQGLISLEAYSNAYGKLREQFMAGTVDGEELATYTKYLLELDDALDESQQRFKGNVAAAEDFARSVMRMNSGIDKLAKGFKDWADVLQNSTEGSHEWLEAITDAKDAVADLLDVLPNDLPTNFITDNIDLIRQAATGSEEAIDALIAKLAELGAAELAPKLVDGFVDDVNNASDSLDALYNKYGDLKAFMEDPLAINLEDSAFIAALQNMLDTSAITREELDRILGTMNLEADYEEQKVTDEEVIQKPKQVQTWTPKEQTVYETYAVPSLLGVTTKQIPITRYNWELTSSAEMEPVTDEVERTAFAMTTSMGGQSGGTPKIKGVHKKATGSSSNYSKQNAGGGSPGGSKKSGGSGGGGGGGKEITPKNANDEIERYHEIDKLISSLSKKLNELSTLKDRAWGGRHISAIRAERAALEEYGGLLDQKLAEAEAYLQSDAAKINAYGAQYDAQGHITNYNQIIANAVEAYNSGAMGDEEYSDLKKKLANYEDSLEKREDLLYEKAENARKILDSKFEEVEYTVEINIEIDDRNIEYIEWLVKHLENKAFSQAEVIDTATRNYDTMLKKWDDYAKGIHDILQTAGASEGDIANYLNGNVKAIEELDDLTADAVEHLGEYTDGLRETYDQLIELKKLIESQLLSLWDEWNDKIEHQIDLMKHQDEILTHYKNIIDIIGSDALGLSSQNLIELSKTQVEAAKKTTEAYKAKMEAEEANLANAHKMLGQVSAEEDIKYWEDEIQRLEKVVADAEEDFYSSWEETIKRAADLYDLTLQRAIKDFESSFSKAFKSFDEALELLDQKKTLAAQYVPEYKKLYELGKLNRDLAKELDKTNNLSAQKKLKDLQDEINDKMREGVQLSEYDLEYLQKKYDLRLAEIALEDAQAAKSTVRLRRDANGNYGYVYTADESQIDDAVQDYEDKLYNIQELTENYLDDLSEAYIQTMSEMTKAIAEIRREDYASEEEYKAKIEQVKDYYTARLQYYTDEINKALNNNQQLYLEDKEYMDRIYGDKEVRQRAFVTDFKQTLVGGVLEGYNNIQDATDTLVEKLGDPDTPDSLIGQLCDNYKNWHTVTNTVLELNKTDFEHFQEDLETIINGPKGINKKITDMRDTVSDMAKKSAEDYKNVGQAIADFQRETSPKLQQLKAETEAYTEAHLKLLEALATHIEDPHNVVTNTVINETIERTVYETSGDSGNRGGSGDSGGGGGKPTKLSPSGSSPTYWTYKIYIDGAEKYSGTGTTQSGVESTASSVANLNNLRLSSPTVYSSKKLVTYVAIKKQQNLGLKPRAVTMSTGGYIPHQNGLADRSSLPGRIVSGATGMYVPDSRYTGDWGADGRLAILHEKELVLNKTDTQNMLSAVETVRQISKTINLQALAEKSNLINRTKNINTSLINSATNGTVEQAITIQADFPAATNRNEIAEAFNQLMQQSLQYAYRYNE